MGRGRRGGSGNAQHGDEPSRYDCDDLHDANPLVLGTRAGRPSDTPIPLCLCKTPASTIPRSGSIAGGMVPEYLSPLPVVWFKGNWQDQDSGIGIGRGAPTMNRRRQGGFQPEWVKFPLLADCVAKRFCASECARLIQDQGSRYKV